MSKRVVTLVAAAGLVVTVAFVASFLLVSLGAPASAADPTGTMTPMETETVTATMTAAGSSATAQGLAPFSGTPAAVPGTIQAEDYDRGGDGVAWFDRTPGNQGGTYREDGVDIEAGGSGHVVALVKSSEWLAYSVNVAEAGTYAATFRTASPWSDREIWVWVDGVLKAQVRVPQTMSFEQYTDATATMALPAGRHTIRLEFYRDAQNLDSFTLERTGTGGGGANVTPTATVTANATSGSGSSGSSGGGPGTVPTAKPGQGAGSDRTVADATKMVEEGRQIFRYDTFGDEAFWTDALELNKAVEGVDPTTALAVGLKVDMDALPQPLVNQIKQGKVNLSDPNTTLALLKLDAVVGVKGNVSEDGRLESLGITCGLCHSTVDDAFAPGIGHRLDGWPNRDLNVGAIINLSPNVTPLEARLGVDEQTVRTVLGSWGPGKFDAELLHDGIAFNPRQVSNGNVTGTNVSGATLLPAAFGLAGVNLHTYTGWGSVTYWNAFVAVTEMQGKGRFLDERLNDPVKFPLDAKFGTWNITPETDLVTAKLPALHFYQLSLLAPTPPNGSFDAAAAARGDELFNGRAQCGRCHVEPLYTEPGWNMHTPEEIGIDAFQANRSPDDMYRTTPLKGLFAHQKGGFFHDGRFATLMDVVNHYDTHLNLNLSEQEKTDLVEYLKSL